MGVMDERSSRLFVGICLLVLLWIGTYWLYEPGGSAGAGGRGGRGKSLAISFDGPDPAMIDATVGQPGPLAGGGVQQVNPGGGAGSDGATTGAVAPVDPSPGSGTQGSDLRVVPPEFRQHTVRQGETFGSIARLYFGPEASDSIIARANPLRDPRRIKAGDVVAVPIDAGNIQGVVVRPDGAPVEPPRPQTPPSVEYLVKAGDSLSRIAQSYYGSTRHADFIFQSNRDVLSSPDRLRVGQTLKLHPLPTEPGNP